MTGKSKTSGEETISLEEAKRQVELTSQRIGLLHLSFAKTIVDELGEEKGKKLILKAIKDYGRKCGERVKKGVVAQGLELTPENYGAGGTGSLPKFGMHEGREVVEVDGEKRVRAYGCVMAKIWREYGEEELGRFYCYIDPAKYMAYNPNFKLVHIKAMPDGDDYCELTVRATTEKEREDFASEDKDWSYIDR